MKKINELLLKEWDPIGVGNTPGAEDEYSQYVSHIYEIIKNSDSYVNLLSYLWESETQYIGLQGNAEKTERFAKMLFNRFRGSIKGRS